MFIMTYTGMVTTVLPQVTFKRGFIELQDVLN